MILDADKDGNLVARADGRDGATWLVMRDGSIARVEERRWKISTTIVPKRFRGVQPCQGDAAKHETPNEREHRHDSRV